MQKWFIRLAAVSGFACALLSVQFQAQPDGTFPLALLGTLMLTVLFVLLAERARVQKVRRMPIVAVQATLCSHRTEYVRDRYRSNHDLMYFVTFRTEDHHLLEFQVSRLNYEDFDVGEAGELRYRGDEFLSFGLLDKSDIQPMMPLPDEYNQPLHPTPARLQRFGAWLKRRQARNATADAESAASHERECDDILTHELEER